MPKIIKRWNVMVHTEDTFPHGLSPIHLGTSARHEAIIEHGFLMFFNHEGAHAGINLSGVITFTIQPEYEE